MTVSTVNSRSSTPERQRGTFPRRVSFRDDTGRQPSARMRDVSPARLQFNGQPNGRDHPYYPYWGHRQPFSGYRNNSGTRGSFGPSRGQPPRFQQQQQQYRHGCCGKDHPGSGCTAMNIYCFQCGSYWQFGPHRGGMPLQQENTTPRSTIGVCRPVRDCWQW
jgi:hypothetical protein